MGEIKKPLTVEERERLKRENAERLAEALTRLLLILEREASRPKPRVKRKLPPEKQREAEENAKRLEECLLRIFTIILEADKKSGVGRR